MIEKRRHERVKASIPVDWGLTPNCQKHDRITSFSVGGCFLQTKEAVPAATILYIRFFLSGEGERIISGEVRYNMENVGLGVQFINLAEPDRADFAALVNYYHVTQKR